jgi:hypothetical protein
MRTRMMVAGAVSGAALLVFATGLAFSQPGRESGARWQYAEVRLSTASPSLAQLNGYGADGWELVNVIAACPGTGSRCEWLAYFKRRM